MTSQLILLKFYYVIINLYDHKLAKSRNFGSPKCKKFKNIQNFSKIASL